jgi:hypothetical protein
MATTTSKVTVTTTAETIVSLDNVTQYVHLHAKGATYIDDTDVTTETGFLLDNDDHLVVTVPQGCSLSAVTSTGSHTLYVLTTRVD